MSTNLEVHESGWLLEGFEPRRVTAHRQAEYDLL